MKCYSGIRHSSQKTFSANGYLSKSYEISLLSYALIKNTNASNDDKETIFLRHPPLYPHNGLILEELLQMILFSIRTEFSGENYIFIIFPSVECYKKRNLPTFFDQI